jgi:hypothetical protein
MRLCPEEPPDRRYVAACFALAVCSLRLVLADIFGVTDSLVA